MNQATKPLRSKPKTRPSTQRENSVEYVVDVIDWSWAYSLSLNSGNHRNDDPYREIPHLRIIGKLLRPARIKTEVVNILLLPTSDMNEEKRKGSRPISLGAFDLCPGMIDGLIEIPSGALTPILQMLISNKLKFVVLAGSKFRGRSARLTDLRFAMRLPDDAAEEHV
jgi:hypothetical protein